MHCSGGTAVEERRAVERNQEENEDREKLLVSDGQICTQPPQEPCDRVLHKNKGGGGRLLRCLLRNHMRKWRASMDYFDFWGSIYFSEAGGKIRDQRCRCEHRVIPKSDWHDGKEKGLALTHTAKVKKKKTFQERKYLTKMQCWIIQCDVSPQIFRKILYTKSMVVCMWVCVVRGRWGICFGRVFILGRRWEERGRRERQKPD